MRASGGEQKYTHASSNVSAKPTVADGVIAALPPGGRCLVVTKPNIDMKNDERRAAGEARAEAIALSAASRRTMLRIWYAAVAGRSTHDTTMHRYPTVGRGIRSPCSAVNSNSTTTTTRLAVEARTLFSARLYGLSDS